MTTVLLRSAGRTSNKSTAFARASHSFGARGFLFIRCFLGSQKNQLQFAFMCQLFAACALNLEQDGAARLPDQADDRVRASSLSTRGTSGVVVDLLADFEGVDWSCHPKFRPAATNRKDRRPQTGKTGGRRKGLPSPTAWWQETFGAPAASHPRPPSNRPQTVQGPPTRTAPIRLSSSYTPTAIKAALIAMSTSLAMAYPHWAETGGGYVFAGDALPPVTRSALWEECVLAGL